MTLLGMLCVALCALSLVATAAGVALGLKARGTTRVRKGAQVHAEMVAESLARQQRRRTTVAQAGIGYGTGIAWERTAVYTLPEIKRAVRDGRYVAVLPAILGMGGLLAAILFGGAALALLTSGTARLVGLMLVGMGVYGAWMIGSDYAKTQG